MVWCREDICNLKDVKVQGNIVRIDRGTVFGNPFVIGRDGDRAQVIQRYRGHMCQVLTCRQLMSLEGKRLACWCHPLPCHGDVLIEWLNELSVAFVDQENLWDATLWDAWGTEEMANESERMFVPQVEGDIPF